MPKKVIDVQELWQQARHDAAKKYRADLDTIADAGVAKILEAIEKGETSVLYTVRHDNVHVMRNVVPAILQRVSGLRWRYECEPRPNCRNYIFYGWERGEKASK